MKKLIVAVAVTMVMAFGSVATTAHANNAEDATCGNVGSLLDTALGRWNAWVNSCLYIEGGGGDSAFCWSVVSWYQKRIQALRAKQTECLARFDLCWFFGC